MAKSITTSGKGKIGKGNMANGGKGLNKKKVAQLAIPAILRKQAKDMSVQQLKKKKLDYANLLKQKKLTHKEGTPQYQTYFQKLQTAWNILQDQIRVKQGFYKNEQLMNQGQDVEIDQQQQRIKEVTPKKIYPQPKRFGGGKGIPKGKGGTGGKKSKGKYGSSFLQKNIKKGEGINYPSIRRLARRAGIKRISGNVKDFVRSSLQGFLSTISQDAITYCQHAKRKTVTARDILQSLRRNGKNLFGFDSGS